MLDGEDGLVAVYAFGPVLDHLPIWSREDGVQKAALDALAQRHAEPFRLQQPDGDILAVQISHELETSTAHLRLIRDRYWDDLDWRRSHHRNGRYPEDQLWQAVDGYLDLLDASTSIHSQK